MSDLLGTFEPLFDSKRLMTDPVIHSTSQGQQSQFKNTFNDLRSKNFDEANMLNEFNVTPHYSDQQLHNLLKVAEIESFRESMTLDEKIYLNNLRYRLLYIRTTRHELSDKLKLRINYVIALTEIALSNKESTTGGNILSKKKRKTNQKYKTGKKKGKNVRNKKRTKKTT